MVDLPGLNLHWDSAHRLHRQHLLLGQDDSSKDFPDNAQQGNVTVAIVVTSVVPVLIKSHYLGTVHVPRYGALPPAQAEQFMKSFNQFFFPCLDDLQGDAILTRGFAGSKTVDGLAELLYCTFLVHFV